MLINIMNNSVNYSNNKLKIANLIYKFKSFKIQFNLLRNNQNKFKNKNKKKNLILINK